MNMLKKLLEEIEIVNRRYGLFKKNDVLILGVSGGSDSIALLILLEKLKMKYSFTLHVAHLNHGLIKSESKRFEDLTRKTAKRLGLPFHCRSIKLRKIAKKHKRSIEEMGRIERYRFFEEIAKRTRAKKIVTAHTLDDQAETILLRLIRGSGLKGLAGIPYIRKHGAFKVVRPLLSCEKSELVSFLKEVKAPFVYDRSNRDQIYTRNRVRHKLLPLLEKYFNPQIKRTLASLQSICSEAQDYLEQASLRDYNHCVLERLGAKKIVLKISRLLKLHPAVAREVVLRSLMTLKGDLKKISYSHIAATMDILNSDKRDLRCNFPGFLVARKKGDNLIFHSSEE